MATKPTGRARKTPAESPTRLVKATRRGRAAKAAPAHEAIAERAYFLHLAEPGADPVANWLRAERELAA